MTNQTASGKQPFRRWWIFLVLAGGYVLVYFHRLCAAVVATDMQRDLHAGGALLGLLGAAYFYPYALMQVPSGLLSDSWGPRRTVSLFFFVALVGSLILALATDFTTAIIGRTLVGLGVAMLFVPTLKIFSHWFSRREFSLMTGVLVAVGGVGSLIATTPLALLSEALSWRGAFLLVGGFTLLLGILVWLVVRDRPSELGLPPPEQGVPEQEKRLPLRVAMGRILGSTCFWPAAGWFFFNCAFFFTYGGLWGGPWLRHVYGLSKTGAGNVLAMMALGMIAGSFLHSYLSNHVFRARKPVIVLNSVISVGLAAVVAFHTGGLSVPMLYILTFAIGLCNNAVVVIGFTLVKELFPLSMSGTATGLVNFFPFAAPALFQPLFGQILETTGKVGDRYLVAGYQQGFMMLFAATCAALVCALLLKEPASHLLGEAENPLPE